MMETQDALLRGLEAAARRAGEIVRHAERVENGMREKAGTANFVTRYDVAVQELLRRELRQLLPGAKFYGEEDAQHDDPLSGACFIVDPIDGTTNFIWDLRHSGISIALAKDGQVEYGVIYNPYLDEMFAAKRGGGATLNGRPVRVKERALSESLVCFGTAPYYRETADETFALLRRVFDRVVDVRRCGAATLDLCDIAAGRCDLFFEARLSPWDFAAGALLVAEAGGEIGTLDRQPLRLDAPCSVAAGSPRAMAEFWELLGK